jgi:hypothetical protein
VVAHELGELCWELSWALLALLLLLFPTGQLPSPHWRPVAWAAFAVLVLAAFSAPFPALRLRACHPTRSPSPRWKVCFASPTPRREWCWRG